MELFYNPYSFWSILIIANIIMYVLTIFISHFWSKINNYKSLKLTK